MASRLPSDDAIRRISAAVRAVESGRLDLVGSRRPPRLAEEDGFWARVNATVASLAPGPLLWSPIAGGSSWVLPNLQGVYWIEAIIPPDEIPNPMPGVWDDEWADADPPRAGYAFEVNGRGDVADGQIVWARFAGFRNYDSGAGPFPYPMFAFDAGATPTILVRVTGFDPLDDYAHTWVQINGPLNSDIAGPLREINGRRQMEAYHSNPRACVVYAWRTNAGWVCDLNHRTTSAAADPAWGASGAPWEQKAANTATWDRDEQYTLNGGYWKSDSTAAGVLQKGVTRVYAGAATEPGDPGGPDASDELPRFFFRAKAFDSNGQLRQITNEDVQQVGAILADNLSNPVVSDGVLTMDKRRVILWGMSTPETVEIPLDTVAALIDEKVASQSGETPGYLPEVLHGDDEEIEVVIDPGDAAVVLARHIGPALNSAQTMSWHDLDLTGTPNAATTGVECSFAKWKAEVNAHGHLWGIDVVGSATDVTVPQTLPDLADVDTTGAAAGNGDGYLLCSSGTSGALWRALPNSITSPTDLSVTGEGSEDTGESTTWTRGSTALMLKIVTRVGYWHDGDETLYGWQRRILVDRSGRLYEVTAESRFTIDVPEEC